MDETVRKSTHCEDISVHVNAHQGIYTINRLFKWKKINRVAVLEGWRLGWVQQFGIPLTITVLANTIAG